MAKLSRREREKLQRRQDILTAATKKFFEKDYDNVSMDEIADDVELSKATLYLYFKNKQSLYFAVVVEGMHILLSSMQTAINTQELGIANLRRLAYSIFEYMNEYADYYRLNRSSRSPRFIQMGEEIENIQEYQSIVMELFSIVQRVITMGMKDGSIKSGLDPLQTTAFISVAIESVILINPEIEMLLRQYKVDAQQYLDHSLDILLHGIAGSQK